MPENVKLVSLDNVRVIKDYIEKVRGEIAEGADINMKDYFEQKLKDVADHIKNQYDDKYDELTKRLEYLEQFGSSDELNEIRLQIDALINDTNDKFDALEALNKELDILNGKYGDLLNSVLSEGQINELIKAAMIEGVTIGDDYIAAENIYATNLVAFIAKFGKITAANIEGGDISGHTIRSSQYIDGTTDPRWIIDNNGAGWLANKNISWTADGDVTFGKDVSLSWDNIKDAINSNGGLGSGGSGGSGGSDNLPDMDIIEQRLKELEGKGTYIDENGLYTGTVLAQNIVGNTITGVTVQGGNNNGDPAWRLESNGDGYLANGKIAWDADTGSVELTGITLDWNDISNKPEIGGDGTITSISKFVSFVFCKTNNTPNAPNGGSYNSPNAVTQTGTVEDADEYISWHDGIPDGEGIIWMTNRTFYSDGSHDNVNLTQWSTPKKLIDSESFTIAYGTEDVANFTDFDRNDVSDGLPVDAEFNADPKGYYSYPWTNEPQDAYEYHYIATASSNNGIWTPWTISKIKGEKGTDGTSIKIKGSYKTLDDFKEAFGNDLNVAPENLDDCYIVGTDLYVWGGAEWINAGPFKGEAGDTYFLHIKYAKYVDIDDTGTCNDLATIELTEKNGESAAGAIWLGVGHSTNPVDPDPTDEAFYGIYKWTKIVPDPIIMPAMFQSIAFVRLPKDIAINSYDYEYYPDGGDWETPLPDDGEIYISGNETLSIIWSDGIPEPLEGDDAGIIWSTKRTFISDGSHDNDIYDGGTLWSTPTKMVDAPGLFETAYGTIDVLNDDGTIDEYGLPIDTDGNANPNGVFKSPWYDEPDYINVGIDAYHYMATASYSNGKWSPWKIFKIKGEQGERGAGIKYAGTLDYMTDLDEYGTVDSPPVELDSAYIIKNNPAAAEDEDPSEWNHLFAWVGDPYGDTDGFDQDGNYIGYYKGWADTGKFNGTDGKTTYVHIKYAKQIVFDEYGYIIPDECIPSENYGESNTDAEWIGFANSTDANDPIIDSEHPENWRKYQWTRMIDPSLIDKRVTTSIGTYHITSNHIAGKTFDNDVIVNIDDYDGTEYTDINYVDLPEGLKYIRFEKDENNYDTGAYREVTVGEYDDYFEEYITEGPSWQIRDDGAGHLAKGNISWDADGKVTFGEGVSLSWDNINSDTVPELGITKDEVTDIITSTEIDGSNIKTGSITAGQIAANTITADQIAPNTITAAQIDTDTLTADVIFGETIEGITIQSGTDVTLANGTKGPAWQIQDNGVGYLASGNISWNKYGKLNAIIDTGTLGQPNPDVDDPEYPMRWDDDTIYIDRNLVFGNNASITWSDNTKPETGAEGITDEEFEEKLTSIGPTWITTQDAIIGQIATEYVKADNIEVKKLNTNPDNNISNVEIYDNKFVIRDDTGRLLCDFSDNPTGLNYTSAFNTGSSSEPETTEYEINTDNFEPTAYIYASSKPAGGSNIVLSTNRSVSDGINIGTYGEGTNISFEYTDIQLTIDISSVCKKSGDNITISRGVIFEIYKDSTLITTINGTNSTSGFSYPNTNITSTHSGSFKYIIPETGSYTILPKIAGTIYSWSLSSTGTITGSISSEPIPMLTTTIDNINNSSDSLIFIGSDGMLIRNSQNGIYSGSDGILFKMGNYSIRLAEDGIYYSTNTESTNPTWNSLI